jgi:hypothetical protein
MQILVTASRPNLPPMSTMVATNLRGKFLVLIVGELYSGRWPPDIRRKG